jgi:hypothetical protein
VIAAGLFSFSWAQAFDFRLSAASGRQPAAGDGRRYARDGNYGGWAATSATSARTSVAGVTLPRSTLSIAIVVVLTS